MSNDRLRRFTFEGHGIRGSLVRLGETWRSIRDSAAYAPAVARILGQATLAAALIGRNLKFEGRLTLQVQGSGPLHLLVLQCTNDLELRGLAKCRDTGFSEFGQLVQPATMTVTVETGAEQERYQSIIPVEQHSLAACLGAYYQYSVQIPTVFWFDVDERHASGLMLQRMPGQSSDDPDAWNHLTGLAGLSLPGGFTEFSDEAVLMRVFADHDVRIFRPNTVRFRCGCSDGGTRRMLRLLGIRELQDIIAAQGKIEVRCEFCNRAYTVAEAEIPGLVAEAGSDDRPTLH